MTPVPLGPPYTVVPYSSPFDFSVQPGTKVQCAAPRLASWLALTPGEWSRWTQLTPDEILQSPYVLIGTVDQMVEDLRAYRDRWGISYYVVHEPYIDAFAPVVARLAGG